MPVVSDLLCHQPVLILLVHGEIVACFPRLVSSESLHSAYILPNLRQRPFSTQGSHGMIVTC